MKHKPTRIQVQVPVGKSNEDVCQELNQFQIAEISQDSKRNIAILQFADHSTAKKCLRHIQNHGMFGHGVEVQYTHVRNEDQRATNRFFSHNHRNHTYEEARNVCRYLSAIRRDPYDDDPDYRRMDRSEANSDAWEIVGARYVGKVNGEPRMLYQWAPSFGPLKDSSHNSWSFLFQQNSDLPEPTMKEFYTEYKKLNADQDLPEDPTEGFVVSMNKEQ